MARTLVWLVAACAFTMSGCSDAELTAMGAGSVGGDMGVEDGAIIDGIVVDPSIFPVPGADVFWGAGGEFVQTDANGSFRLGPLPGGQLTVRAEKKGYSAAEQVVTLVEGETLKLRLTIEPIAGDVPFHETASRTMYIICHAPISLRPVIEGGISAPCGLLVDVATGGSNTIDQSTYLFTVEKPGLANLVLEMTWSPQPMGHDGLLQLSSMGGLNPAGGSGAMIDKTVYADEQSSPFWYMLTPGKLHPANTGGNTPFYPQPNTTEKFKMFVAGGTGNNTVPNVGVFVEYKPTVYTTFFYNRAAPPRFSFLPDQ